MAQIGRAKETCRLCYYETTDTIDIFSEIGLEFNYVEKLAKYLYLKVDSSDDLPKAVCGMCTEQLRTFHKFYSKINEIQKSMLNERYLAFILIPQYISNSAENDKAQSDDAKQDVLQLVLKMPSNDEAIEEYELIEVDESEGTSEENSTPAQLMPCQAKSRRQPSSMKIDSNIRRTSKRLSKHLQEKTIELNEIEEYGTDDECTEIDSNFDEHKLCDANLPKEIIKNGIFVVKGRKLMEIINKFYSLTCELCAKPFDEIMTLFDHYTTEHNQPGCITCCESKFSRYPAIAMHMVRHLQPDAFKCDMCGYSVSRPRFLEYHKLTHLPESEKRFACDYCSKRFCWKGALQIHMNSHQPEDKRRKYVCHTCGKSYDTPSGLSTHKKNIHSDVKNRKEHTEQNICHICAKNFATRTSLNEHMSIHQPREIGQIQCSECGKWLMNRRCLKTHMVLHSDQEFSCEQCDYVTKKQVLLNRHMITQHTNETPFACEMCGRRYKMKRALTIHMAQHTKNSQSFKCTFCDRVYNSSTNYYVHRKKAHPKEWAEMIRQKEEMNREKRIVAGIEKPSKEKEFLSEEEEEEEEAA